MRITRVSAVMAVLTLLAVACAEDGTTGDGSPSPTAQPTIPSVSIDQCQTPQGAQPPADPKGVDFNAQLNDPGILHIGSDNDFPPFEETKPGEDEPVGFAVDLYTEIADRLGLEARSTTTSFDGLFTQSIPGNEFDLGVSSITIKEERKQTVDFTIAYFEADLSLAINSELTPDIKTIQDLDGLTIGAQQGTTGEECANFLVAQGLAAEVKSFDTSSLMFQDLSTGGIAAVVNDRPASQGFVDKDSALAVVQVIETREQYGMAISKDKPDLRVAVNEALTAMMEDGTYAQIYETWFETPPPFEVPIR
ncbi:MAG TPA: transporter substrate-binding domain-containing protein [Actinomycetota bacterium]